MSNHFLSVEDVEIAFSNPDHLRDILRDHGFVYELSKGKSNQPGSIKNPLYSNRESDRTEYWKPELNKKTSLSEIGSGIIRSVCFYDWKSSQGPYPPVTKTITLWISADLNHADKVESFFERIKVRYPSKTQRFIGNSELQRAYTEPINVFVNSTSKIEIQMNQAQVGSSKEDVSDFHIVSFNLVK